jgi:hypothetical protein
MGKSPYLRTQPGCYVARLHEVLVRPRVAKSLQIGHRKRDQGHGIFFAASLDVHAPVRETAAPKEGRLSPRGGLNTYKT